MKSIISLPPLGGLKSGLYWEGEHNSNEEKLIMSLVEYYQPMMPGTHSLDEQKGDNNEPDIHRREILLQK